jgi:beta-glucanase (GH16 family)
MACTSWRHGLACPNLMISDAARPMAAATRTRRGLHMPIPRTVCLLIWALTAASAPASLRAAAAEPPASPPGWTLVWHDEFDGAALDRGKWTFELGNGFKAGTSYVAGWGNDELEFYTDRADNAFVKDGALHLKAIKEDYQGCRCTSARVVTRGLYAKTYGRFEFRAKLPLGQGVWPAIWLLPQDCAYGAWAASGEIDILEARGQEPTKVLGTLHYGSRWPKNTYSGATDVLPDHGAIDAFHVYALEWDAGEIRWYVDGALYSTKSFWWSSSKHDGAGNGVDPQGEADLNPWPAPFDKPFYILLNLAVGGRFLGNPDVRTPFPAEMVINYVRVYQRTGGAGDVHPRGAGALPGAK